MHSGTGFLSLGCIFLKKKSGHRKVLSKRGARSQLTAAAPAAHTTTAVPSIELPRRRGELCRLRSVTTVTRLEQWNIIRHKRPLCQGTRRTIVDGADKEWVKGVDC